jgi:hypothetical protein
MGICHAARPAAPAILTDLQGKYLHYGEEASACVNAAGAIEQRL